MFLGGASGGKAVEDTATGNPVTFLTDLAKPLKSLVANFLPIQSSGTPSPDNIIPITGWDAVSVDHISENLWKNNETQSFTRYIKVTLSQTLPAGTYTFTATVESETTGTECAVGFSKGNNNIIATVKLPKSGRHSATFTVNDTVDTVYMYADIDYAPSAGLTAKYSGILIEEGTDAPERHTATFPSTIYGGYVDMVTGEVRGTWVNEEFDGSPDELWDKISGGSASAFAMYIQISGKSTSADSYICDSLKNIARNETWGNYDNWISDNQNSIVTGIKAITTVTDWRAYLAEHPIHVAYKLATPVLITTLTPQQINAIKGNNTVWSDANGDCSVTFLKKG